MTHPTPDQPPSVMSAEEAHALWCEWGGPLNASWDTLHEFHKARFEALAAEISRRAVEAEREGYDPLPHYSVAYLSAQLDAANATIARLREALQQCDPDGVRSENVSPEDGEILAICERIGFGAVMDSAARQWRRKDPIGAFTVGPCAITVRQVLAVDARQALETEERG